MEVGSTQRVFIDSRRESDSNNHGRTTMPRALLLCDDLIFTSKVLGTAKVLNQDVKSARDVRTLLHLAKQEAPSCIILDLHNPGLDLGTLMAELRETCPAMPRVVAYGSHVEAATLHAARVAGCDPVWPRSKFVEELATALPGWVDG